MSIYRAYRAFRKPPCDHYSQKANQSDQPPDGIPVSDTGLTLTMCAGLACP